MLKLVVSIVVMLIAANTPANAEKLDHLASLQGGYEKIDSEILERPFHIYVRLPLDYYETKTDYPVVYTLDGDILFPILGAYHTLLQYDEPNIPEAIVVGISYGTFDPEEGNYRSIDYSAPPLEDGNVRGGASAFQRFLKYELIPHIEQTYRADAARRILIGQSRGGHFVLYSAYTDPELFWGRISSNPAFAPNKKFFFAGEALPALTSTSLFFASAENDIPELREDALAWFELWPESVQPPWRLNTVTMTEETHAAGIVRIYRDGMKWLFEESQDTE